MAKKSIQSAKPNDMLTHKTESINSLSSKNSSKPLDKDNIAPAKSQPQKYVDLFAEPPEDLHSTTSSTSSSSRQNIIPQTISTERPSTFRTKAPPFVDLFAEPPEDIPSSNTSSISSAGQHIKRKTVNLFDDDEEDDLAKDDLLSSITKKQELEKPKVVEKSTLPTTKTVALDKPLSVSKTAKSLFEDSEEDDDDFLKAFVKKSSAKDINKTSLAKSLFDKEFQDNSESESKEVKIVKDLKNKTSNIFNEIDENEDDSLFSKSKDKKDITTTAVRAQDNSKLEDNSKKEIPITSVRAQDTTKLEKDSKPAVEKENIKKNVNLFDDLEDDFKPQSLQAKAKPKINLFDDLEDDEGDDIFAIKPKGIPKEKTNVKDMKAENIPKKNVTKEIDNVIKNDDKSKEIIKEKPNIKDAIAENIPKETILKEIENLGKNDQKLVAKDDTNVEESLMKPGTNSDHKNDHKEENKLEESLKKSLANSDEQNAHKNVAKKDRNFEESVKKLLTNFDQVTEHKNFEEPAIIISQNQQGLSQTVEKVNVPQEIVKQEELLNKNPSELKPDLKQNKEDFKNPNETANEEKVVADVSKLENTETSKENLKQQKELNNNDSLTLQKEQILPTSTKETQKSTNNKYEFNSILFLDEPPEDDNEFFETLTKTPQTLNTNYNVIDLEHDLYEPELPKIPGTNSINKPTDTIENKQTNVYTGLQLFSDVPPDDDGDDQDIGNVKNSNENNQTKRLHSVFYDDFNETLMALNKNQIDKEIPKHSIYSEEPPPINEELNFHSEDSIDHKVPELKDEQITKEDVKKKTLEIVSKLEDKQHKSDNKTESVAVPKKPVSKLQMPHININVQALLPGANNTLRKTKEDNSPPKIVEDIKPKTNVSVNQKPLQKHSSIEEKQIVEVKRSAETEHILPSVTKNRTKGPARRPSTRRARQENYRKSMIEDQQSLGSDNEFEKGNKDEIKSVITNIPEVISKPETTKQQSKDKPNEVKPSNTLSSILFEDQTKDDLDIFNVTKKSIKTNESNSKRLTEELVDKLNKVKEIDNQISKELGTKIKTATNKSSLLFEDDEEEDDDLFKHIRTNKTNENKPIQAIDKDKEMPTATVSPSVTNTKLEVTKEIPIAGILEAKLDTKTQQTLKTNDNLLNKSHDLEATKPPKMEIKPKINNPASTNKVNSSFLDEEDDDDDLFKTSLQKPLTTKSSIASNIKAKAQFKSFLDSESDDDTKVAGLPTTSSVKSQTVVNTKASTNTAPVQKNTNTKLFNDSDTDSDDLFGKLSTSKTSQQKIATGNSKETSNAIKSQIKTQPPPSSSLFSDESDDEDFLKTSSKIDKTPVSKNTSQDNKTKRSNQTNASLFSDIDSDEDDLFGGGAAAAKGTTTKGM